MLLQGCHVRRNTALSFYMNVCTSSLRVSCTCCVCVPSLCPCLCSWISGDRVTCSVFCLMLGWSGGCWSGFGAPSGLCLCLCLSPGPAPALSPALAPSRVPSPSHAPFHAPSPFPPPLSASSPSPPSHARGLLCPVSQLGFHLEDLLSGGVISPKKQTKL